MKTADKTRGMVLTALFAVIIAICSWISIPTTVPFTMQTFGVFLSLALLGGKRGTISICVYLLLGFIGIPVFAGGTSGIGVFLGASGGYLIGFAFSGFTVWGLESVLERKTWTLVLSMLLGLIVCYVVGTIWFMAVYTSETGQTGIWTALSWCVIPFVIPDVIKIALALLLQKRLAPLVK